LASDRARPNTSFPTGSSRGVTPAGLKKSTSTGSGTTCNLQHIHAFMNISCHIWICVIVKHGLCNFSPSCQSVNSFWIRCLIQGVPTFSQAGKHGLLYGRCMYGKLQSCTNHLLLVHSLSDPTSYAQFSGCSHMHGLAPIVCACLLKGKT
jgi:hypothetical protein